MMASVESNGQIVKRLHMQLIVNYQKLPLLHQHCLVDVNFTLLTFTFARTRGSTQLFSFDFFCTFSLFYFATFFTFDRSRVLVNATFFFSPNFQYHTLSGSTGVSNFCQQQYCVLFHPYLTDLL